MSVELTSIGNAYGIEHDAAGAFVWVRNSFTLPKRPGSYMVLLACYYGVEGELSITLSDGSTCTTTVQYGWHEYAIPLKDTPPILHCKVHPVPVCDGETRQLALMVRSIAFSSDTDRMLLRRCQNENLLQNNREFRSGAQIIRSIPPRMETNLCNRCNINPPCVYCQWDSRKQREETCSHDLGALATIRQLGDFFRLPCEYHDSSVGEPLMNPSFAQLAEHFLSMGAHFSFTTNGIFLTEDKYKPLLGANARVSVSLDAPDAEMYGWYCNSQFGILVENVKRLCERRKAYGGKPEVFIGCVAMQSNYDRIQEVLELTADMGCDAFVLRSLYINDPNVPAMKPTNRNGHHFNYPSEILGLDRLMTLAERMRPIAKKLGLDYYVDHADFHKQCDEDKSIPLCFDPWKSVYLMARGILPCCFGGHLPLATWDQQGDRTIQQFVWDAINSAPMQDIRKKLAIRQLPEYCRSCQSCPIVKREIQKQR